MIFRVYSSGLQGTVKIPGSKSHTIRAVALASLAAGKSEIVAPLISSDTLSAVKTYSLLGADIDSSDNTRWIVNGTRGQIAQPNETIDVGNSGTTLRIAAGSASLADQDISITLTGDKQIRSRPIDPLIRSLNELGAKVMSLENNGMAPLSVSGKLKGGKTSIECFTSQYLSSLLFACPLAEKDTEIEVPLLYEPDYVQMTLDWLDEQGIEYENDNMKRFNIKGNQQYKPFSRQIPADFSSATFFLCAGALLDADITITGLDFSDSQPDKAVADYLKKMNADINIETDGTVRVRKSELTGTEIDMNRTPDALPAMAVTAAFAKGTTKLLNVPQARKKETDRIACMARELKKMGVAVEELPDGLIIHQADRINAAQLQGHDDHRIVMALTIAAMACDQPSTINTAQAAAVTFPEFRDLMCSLGANIEIENDN